MDPRPSDALRASNDVLQREVDTIELLQTDLERARRDVTIARANVRVMNLGEKERGELRCVQGHKRFSPIAHRFQHLIAWAPPFQLTGELIYFCMERLSETRRRKRGERARRTRRR